MREIQVTTERKTQLVDITAGVRDAVGSDAGGSAVQIRDQVDVVDPDVADAALHADGVTAV